MKPTNKKKPKTKPLRGAREIAAYLGIDDEWRGLFVQMREGRIPVWKFGRSYRAYPDVLDNWTKAQQQLAIEGRDAAPQAIWALMEKYANEAKADADRYSGDHD